jgi:thiol:disulfide interchange protein DsbD
VRRLAFLALLLCAGWLHAADPFKRPGGAIVHDEFLPVEQAYQLQVDVIDDHLLLHWDIADGYYLYRHPFDFAVADGTRLTAALPAGKSKVDEYFGQVEVYYHSLDVKLAGLPAAAFTLQVTSQGCADAGLCYPPRTERFSVDPVARTVSALAPLPPGVAATAAPAGAPAAAPGLAGWATLLLGALLGGAILNLMPCVFPVLSLKVLSFAHHRDQSQAVHGVVYTAGVVASFVAVAALLLALKAGGSAVGWGFQLQQPWFVGALAYLFFAMGLSLSGFWELGGRWLNFGGTLAARSDYTGSFFTGVLATVVASPCTAPFMAGALGFAITQPAPQALAVFATLGFGMALPVLVLCLQPRLLARLPRPGNWMIRLKQALAFPLYATTIWLAWIVGRQAGATAMAALLLGGLLLALALWLWRFAPLARIVAALALAGALGILGSGLLASQPVATASAPARDWQPYSSAKLDELRRSGTAVFLNMTADWCITCLANEKVALSRDSVRQAFRERGVAYLKGDWTQYDPAITELLARFGRNGVPLYVFYPANGEPVVLPQLLTPDTVIAAITPP